MGPDGIWKAVRRLAQRQVCGNPNHYACQNVLHHLPPHRGHRAGLLESLRRDLADLGKAVDMVFAIFICP